MCTLTEKEARQEKRVQGAQEEVTKPEGRMNKTRLSTDPDSSHYELSGPRQRCPVHKPLANRPSSLIHTPQIYVFGTHKI